MLLELIYILIGLCGLRMFCQSRRSQRAPPGPWAPPLIGNLFNIVLGGGFFATATRWAKRYGPVFSYSLGKEQLVVINDPKLLRELFSKRAASGRPRNPIFATYANYYGLVFSDGPNWEEQRPFCIGTMKTYGYGKTSILECRTIEACQSLASYFENNLKVPLEGRDLFLPYLTGAIWGLMVSESDENEKQEVVRLVRTFFRGFNTATASGLMFFPAMRFIAPNWTGWTPFKAAADGFKEFLAKRIEKNRTQLDPSNLTGLIDHYLAEIDSTLDPTSPFYKEKGYQNLMTTMSDLFGASIEAIEVTLEWAMVLLSQHTTVQRKLQQELDDIIGKSRFPCLADRSMLPYMEAVLLEIMRVSSIAPYGVAHRLMEDIEFHGYLLEKDTIVQSALYAIHYDPNLWGEDVAEFNPDRFLNEDKTAVVQHDSLIPFSVGKRKCLGENAGMDTMFLFLASIFQKFSLHPDPERPTADLSRTEGFTVSPKPFRIVVCPRE